MSILGSEGYPPPVCDVCSTATGSPCTLERGHPLPHLYYHPPDSEGEQTAMKADKLMMELVDLDFIADMALQLQAGLKGDRVPDGWKQLDPVKYLPKYRGAVLRHLRHAHTPGAVDPETKASHWAAVAVNAMIAWHMEQRGLGEENE